MKKLFYKREKLFYVLLCCLVCSSLANAQASHDQIIKVGNRNVTVRFSDYPVRAERSLNITFSPDGGITGLQATGKFVGLSDEFTLDRFPSNRKVWGFDDISFKTSGKRTFELHIIGVGKGRLEFTVGERPAGPSSELIYALGVMPILALFVLAFRAWRQVQPARQSETYNWQ
ncbi:MAG: hypothetical protein RLZZ156_375 [Deinococcota bacterium]|jgi:hypothetical protein